VFIFLIWGSLAALAGALGVGFTRTLALRRYVVAGVFSFLIGGFLGWFIVPTLNFSFVYLWFSFLVFMTVGGAIGMQMMNTNRHPYGPWAPHSFAPYSVVGIAVPLFLLMTIVSTWGAFHADAYHALLGKPKAAQTFSSDVAAVDTSRLRVVGEPLAQQIMDKMLGDQSGLGSQVSLGDVNITQLNGCFSFKVVGAANPQRECFTHELVWVAPMVNSGLLRWMSNGTTHEYALVSASDPTRKFFITEVNGKPLNLRYMLDGAYFGDYLERYLRTSGYMSQGLTDYSFELDDQGKPWWVITTFEKRVGFSGDDATGVLAVDPETGAITRYTSANAPAWVDRIQPSALVIDQFDNWGTYVHGWLNSWTGKRDMVQTSTNELHLVEGLNGRTYWYTGVTSYGNDNSTTGFVLVDTKSKMVRYYKVAGATEDAAQGSAQNAPGVKEKNYHAGEPILYNMDGHPTYFMVLSGTDNLPRMYAFVSVRDYQIVGVGDTVSGALRQYESKISTSGRSGLGQTAVVTKTIQGTVARIVRDGDSWDAIIQSDSAAEYVIPGALSAEVKYTQIGDKVSVTYQEIRDRPDRPATAFDNLDLQLSGATSQSK
jgi:hypothetical protein